MKTSATTVAQKSGFFILFSSLLLTSWAFAETKVSGEIEVGNQTTDVSSNEAKFEEFGEVPNGVIIPHIDLQSTGDHDQVGFEANHVKQNNQSYDLNYNHDYKLNIDASWDQMPHDYSNVGRTLYNQATPGVLTLPSGVKNAFSQSTSWSSANTPVNSGPFVATLSSFTAGAQNIPLGIQDNKGSVNFGFRSGEHMKYDFGYSEDKIEGAKAKSYALSGSFPIQMPVPVDWKVYNMHAGTQYVSKDAQLGVNYLMSAFNNNIETLIWDNPRRLTDSLTNGAAQGQAALAPDNWSHTVTMNGGVNLPAKTRFTAKGSMGYMTQNQDLLPITDNSALVASNVAGSPKANSLAILPEQSANAKVMTWTQDYALTNRAWKPLTLGVHYHSYQFINKTAEVDFPGRSSWDSSYSAGPFSNDRFEFRKDTIEGSGEYQIFDPWSVGLRYATEWDHRIDREIRDTTEKTFTATTDVKVTKASLLRGTYLRAHRRPQDFNGSGIFEESSEGGPATFEELPGLRRFDTSDRLRDQGKILAQWNPGAVMLSFNGSLTHDNFQPGMGDLLEGTTNQAAMFGLLESRDASAGGDIGWDAADRLSFDAYYQYEETTGLQRNNTAGTTSSTTGNANIQLATKNYSTRSVDRYHMAGVSARVGKPSDRVGVRLAYDITMSRGANDFVDIGPAVIPASVYVNGVSQTLTPGLLTTPADTKFMKQDISVKTNVRLSDRVSLVFGYLYEKYDVSNWQYQNIPLVGGSSAGQTNIFLGTNLQNYVAHVGSVVAKYKF